MNVLVVSVPASGHLRPLLALVEAHLAQGDRVVVAAGADMSRAVAASGAEFQPAGHSETEWFDQLRARVRGTPGDGLRPERINHYFVPRVFADIGAVDMVDDVLAIGRSFAPDVVMFETYALAAPLVAELLGAPGVHHLISPMLPLDVVELANDAVSPLWRSFGLDAPSFAGLYRGVTIQPFPPMLERLEVPSGEAWPLGVVSAPRAPTSSSRPLVYVTLGTLFGSALEVFRAALDGLADEAVDVVVTVGEGQDPTLLAPIPANATVERFIPQATLLPSCAVVVHHGGSGTTLGSIAHGLPQVVIPQGADNFLNADRLADAGMAVVLRPGEVTAAGVLASVRTVLRDPCYAEAARSGAEEVARMPAPSDVALELHRRFG